MLKTTEALSTHAVAAFRADFADEFSARSWGAPVVVVVALKKQEYLAPELLHFDRFSRCLSLPQLDDAQHGQIFVEICNGVHFDQSVTENLEEAGAIVRRLTYLPRRNLAHALRRLCWQEVRAATLRDLIELESFGSAERDRPSVSKWLLWRNAVHEAGHAVAGYLECGRTQVPRYCSVVSRPDCLGIVMPSRAESRRTREGDVTYSDWVQDVRVLLAGRAAEQVLLGADQILPGGRAATSSRLPGLSGACLRATACLPAWTTIRAWRQTCSSSSVAP